MAKHDLIKSRHGNATVSCDYYPTATAHVTAVLDRNEDLPRVLVGTGTPMGNEYLDRGGAFPPNNKVGNEPETEEAVKLLVAGLNDGSTSKTYDYKRVESPFFNKSAFVKYEIVNPERDADYIFRRVMGVLSKLDQEASAAEDAAREQKSWREKTDRATVLLEDATKRVDAFCANQGAALDEAQKTALVGEMIAFHRAHSKQVNG